MILIYINDGNTVFYDVPDNIIKEIRENVKFVNKASLSNYYIGKAYCSLNTKDLIQSLPIDLGIISLNENPYDFSSNKFIIDREHINRYYDKIHALLLELGHQETVSSECRIIAYEKDGKYLLFKVNKEEDRGNKNEFYRKCYVGSFDVSDSTRELLSSRGIELMAEPKEEITAKM